MREVWRLNQHDPRLHSSTAEFLDSVQFDGISMMWTENRKVRVQT